MPSNSNEDLNNNNISQIIVKNIGDGVEFA